MDIQNEVSHLIAPSLEQDAQRLASDPKSKDAAERFEALLATMLVKEMRRGLEGGVFGDVAGSDIFEGWFDKHVGDSLAKSGSLDLAGLIKVGIDTKADALKNAEADHE